MCAEKADEARVARRRPWSGPNHSESEVAVKETGPEPATGTGDGSLPDRVMDAETAMRIRRKHMTWREWFLYDFLRHWYWLGALSLVAFFLMQISWMYHVKDLAGLSVLGICSIMLIILEFYAYKAVWPEGGLTEGWPAGRRLRRAFRRLRWRL